MCLSSRSHPRFYVCLYQKENPQILKYFTSVGAQRHNMCQKVDQNTPVWKTFTLEYWHGVKVCDETFDGQ